MQPLTFFFKLRQPPTISTVKCIKRRKEEKLIENHTPFQMFLEFIQKYRNAQKPQRNCTFMNSASLLPLTHKKLQPQHPLPFHF